MNYFYCLWIFKASFASVDFNRVSYIVLLELSVGMFCFSPSISFITTDLHVFITRMHSSKTLSLQWLNDCWPVFCKFWRNLTSELCVLEWTSKLNWPVTTLRVLLRCKNIHVSQNQKVMILFTKSQVCKKKWV